MLGLDGGHIRGALVLLIMRELHDLTIALVCASAKLKTAYQVVPVSTAKGRIARTHVLEAKPNIEAHKVFVSQQSHTIRNSGVLNSLNIGLHENCSQSHTLMFLGDSK